MKKYALITGLVICCASITWHKLQSQDPAMFNLYGFATVNGGTTGGSGGDTLTVTTGTALQDALNDKQDSETPLVIWVKGTINLANSPELSKIDIKDVSDVSIIGASPYAEFDGIGMKITRASNIIVRNLKIHHVLSGEKDCIGIEGPADHIWIDHCELYNEYQGVDKDYYDGLLDAKAEAEYLTYSWNFLHDSWKTALVGSSESDIYDRKLTMHHNYFLNCNSRLPLFRASTGHFFNNYYKDIASTAINTRINSCVRIEKNYFENAQNPWVSAYSDVLGGGEAIDNILVNSPFIYSGDTHEMLECSPVIPYEFEQVLHDASAVPGLVMAFAGVGKIYTTGDPVYVLSTGTSGAGTILVNPEKTWYDSGDVVILTAVPEPGWDFDGWSDSVSGTDNPLSLVMNENKTVTANFSTDKFEMIYHNSGPGTIQFDPAHKPLYDSGEVVNVTAVPEEGAYFTGWSGDLDGNENPVSFPVDSNMEITASFKFNAADALEVQFEEEYCSVNGSVKTEHAGYTGSGFIDFANETGSDLVIAVDATEETNCNLVIRYAHGKTEDRSMEVMVNGVSQVADLDLPSTGAWTTWDTVSCTITLAEGNNKIRFVSLTSSGGPNFDRADLAAADQVISKGFCNDSVISIPAPGNLTAFIITENHVALNWKDNSDNEEGFILERSNGGEGYVQITDLQANVTFYTDDQVLAGNEYAYRVKAYGGAVESSYSNIVTVSLVSIGHLPPLSERISLRICPNPVRETGNIEFTLSHPGKAVISLIDMTGRRTIVLEEYVAENTKQNISFDAGKYLPGVYLIEIRTGSSMSCTRFMISGY